MRCLLRELPRVCTKHELKGWRKRKFWTKQAEAAFQRVRTSRQWRNVAKVEAYLDLCRKLVARMQVSLAELRHRRHQLTRLRGTWTMPCVKLNKWSAN